MCVGTRCESLLRVPVCLESYIVICFRWFMVEVLNLECYCYVVLFLGNLSSVLLANHGIEPRNEGKFFMSLTTEIYVWC
jgi:hypothetical protein